MHRLKLLLLEDNELDAELTLAHLDEGGFQCDAVRVDNQADFEAQLRHNVPNLILADYSLPAFDGITALRIAQQHRPDVPFIFVSGALGEELAIETLKEGATDYVLKYRLERLAPSVRRALREAEDRATRRMLEEELRRRAEELAESDRRKDEFLAILAHELRNPLAPIFNALFVMSQPSTDTEAAQRARQMVERHVRHMARLLDDLLDISRITRGKILLRKQHLDLSRLVRDTVEDHRIALEDAGLTFTVTMPDDPVWLCGDPTRIAQILGNLLNNAAKFTPPGGHVAVTLRTDANHRAGILQVRDTGIGLDQRALSDIFKPFAQDQRGLTQNNSGLGLGLALVRGLVELHGGRASVESPGPNKGTTFTCEFPLSLPAEASLPLETALPAAARSRPDLLRILIIDDNRDAADTLADVLELGGHEVHVAYSGTEGVQLAREIRPQVVFCDLGLPGLDGYSVAALLRSEAATRNARLVAVSGYGQPDDRRRSREAGFEVHLTKPVDPATLEDLLRDLRQDTLLECS